MTIRVIWQNAAVDQEEIRFTFLRLPQTYQEEMYICNTSILS